MSLIGKWYNLIPSLTVKWTPIRMKNSIAKHSSKPKQKQKPKKLKKQKSIQLTKADKLNLIDSISSILSTHKVIPHLKPNSFVDLHLQLFRLLPNDKNHPDSTFNLLKHYNSHPNLLFNYILHFTFGACIASYNWPNNLSLDSKSARGMDLDQLIGKSLVNLNKLGNQKQNRAIDIIMNNQQPEKNELIPVPPVVVQKISTYNHYSCMRDDKLKILVEQLICAAQSHPTESIHLLDLLIQQLIADKNNILTPKMYTSFLITLLQSSIDESSTFAILKILQKVDPIMKAKDQLLAPYFIHWSSLSTLDVIEKKFSPNFHSLVTEGTISLNTAPSKSPQDLATIQQNELFLKSQKFQAYQDIRINDFLRLTHPSNPDLEFFAIVKSKSKDGSTLTLSFVNNYHLNCFLNLNHLNVQMDLDTIFKKYSKLMEKYNLNVAPYTVEHHEVHSNENQLIKEVSNRWKVYRVDTVTSLTTPLEALETFCKFGQSVTNAYDILMKNVRVPLNRNPSPIPRRIMPTGLNESQMDAIRGVMDKPVSLIQGPPGTGKTHTLSKLIKTLSLKHGPGSVLVVAPTNAATDNIVEYALRENLRVVRMGDVNAIREDLLPYSIEHIVPNAIENFPSAQRVIRQSDVVCTTVHSSGGVLLDRLSFKYVIVDEASQVTEPTALIPIVKQSQSIILVGDHKQLPPSVGYWASRQGFSESLFSRLSKTVEPLLLDTQYRSHPMIMEFSSNEFYGGKLKTGVSKNVRQPPAGFPWRSGKDGLIPVAFVESPHLETPQSGMSKSNPQEAELVIKILNNLVKKSGLDQSDIGLISPYAGQNQILRNLLKRHNLTNIEINSVDGFQGREKEIIVFSCTRANSFGQIGFLNDPRRLNVMHTRAKRGLIVIGHRKTLATDPVWKRWLDWIDSYQLAFNPKSI